MNAIDTVEIRVHPLNLPRVLNDARERGAKVTECEDGLWQIDDLPVILDPYIDVHQPYAVSYGGGDFWR
jgi:hypothetical protein